MGLAGIRQYLVDVLGTLITEKGGGLVPGATGFLSGLRRRGLAFRLVSNNTSQVPEEVVARLAAQGLPIDQACYMDALQATAAYLGRQALDKVYLIGTRQAGRYLEARGLECLAAPGARAVVVGLDKGVDFPKLKVACEALLGGAVLVAMHVAPIYKDADGLRAPGAGAFVRALEYATGAEAVVLGKPAREFWQEALRGLPHGPGETLLVSDDPVGDLAGGKAFGFKTAFVLSGKYNSPEEVLPRIEPGLRPDFTFDSVAELAALLDLDSQQGPVEVG